MAYMNRVNFFGNDYNTCGLIGTAKCDTAKGTSAKTASVTDPFDLNDTFLAFQIIFTDGNTATSPLTLSLNNSHTKSLSILGTVELVPNRPYTCYYNGSNFVLDNSLGNVVNTSDSAIPVENGTTKFTTGGAYTEFSKINAEIDEINRTLKQISFDASHPIGSTYVQFPQQDSPQTLFDAAGVTSTWEVVNYDGAFFRAQGTNANDFIEKTGVLSKQGDMVKSHTHGFTPDGDVNSSFSGTNQTGYLGNFNQPYAMRWENCDGNIFKLIPNQGERNGIEESGIDQFCRIDFSYTPTGSVSSSFSGHYGTTYSNDDNSGENRPTNYTIRVWKRMA